MNKIMTLALCLCLLLSLLCGCAQEEVPHVPTGDGLTWDDPTAPGQIQNQPLEEEQLLTMVYYPDRSFNPYTGTDFTNRALFSLLYQGLFATDSDYNVSPILCKKYSMSDDMKTYTFYIHEAYFSDGTRLTISDVFASLQAAMENDVYRGRFTRVDEMYLSWDGGITFELEVSYENFPILLDVPIVKAVEVDADRPLGTGPYKLNQTASGMRLLRRTDWWCSAKLPINASAITLVEAENEAQIRDNFEFADVNLVCADPGSDNYVDYRCDYELWDCENGIFLYLSCNMSSAVFSNSTVRAALTYAIDRDAIVAKHYRGFARSATLAASPDSPYYDRGLASRYTYDALKFVDAVSSAGLSGASINFLVNKDDSLRLRVARDIADMLREGGLKVTMYEFSGDNYKYALTVGNFDIYLGQTKLSPNMDLTSFFAPGGNLRKGGISDAAIYATCMDSLENSGNYYNLHEMVAEDGRLCPVLFRSYAIYATRGLLSDLDPARENIFAYNLGTTLEEALTEQVPEPTQPETTAED